MEFNFFHYFNFMKSVTEHNRAQQGEKPEKHSFKDTLYPFDGSAIDQAQVTLFKELLL